MFKLQFASLEDVLSFMLDFSDVTGLTISRNANDDSLVQTFIFNSEFENIDAKYWNKGIDPIEKRCEPNCSFCESDKQHYQEMSEFFDEMLPKLQFHILIPICSRCGKDAYYVGLISTQTSFAFCVDCRDELTLKKNAAIAAQERIGA